MAASYVRYNGNGATTNFTVSFPYLDKSHVKVKVGGVLKIANVDYTFLSATVIQFVTAPPTGTSNVEIRRSTPTTPPWVDFVDGSTLVETNLDGAPLQALYIVEEAYDLFNDALAATSTASLPNPSGGNGKFVQVKVDETGYQLTAVSQLPSPTGQGTNIPRVNVGGTDYELRTPAQVRADVGANDAANLNTGTVNTARLGSGTANSKSFLRGDQFYTLPVMNGTSRLTRASATSLELGIGVIPLKVNGEWTTRRITAAVAINTAGLAANTLYYVYAADSTGNTVLELSATGHTVDADYGVEIKSADATRTLVGMARTNGSTQFVDSVAQRFVASWFNRKLATAVGTSAGGMNTTSTTYAEISSGLRAEFITWAGDIPCAGGGGDVNNGTAGGFVFVGISLDGVATVSDGAGGGQSSGAGTRFFFTALGVFSVTEGYHYTTLVWRVNTGTGTLNGSTPEQPQNRAVLYI